MQISSLLLTDDSKAIKKIKIFIRKLGLKIRKIETERIMIDSSVYYHIVDGKWDIHLYNYTRHKSISFPYIYLSISSILRREKIWFKTINPISFDEINSRIIVDHFGKSLEGAENFRSYHLQGFYLGFEIDYLLRNKKINPTDVINLFHDCGHMPEQAGYCAALKRNKHFSQAKIINDFFWECEHPEYNKSVERIEECLERNSINEKDLFYVQQAHFPELKEINFDEKFDIFMKNNTNNLDYDLAISFAGEDRDTAKEIADKLTLRGYKIFYDEYEKSKMWGKDLYEFLSNIYRTKAKYCLILISEKYVEKAWTKHEKKSAQAREFLDDNEYILPLRLDGTEVPGILPTTGYIDLRNDTIDDVVKLLVEKINDYDN